MAAHGLTFLQIINRVLARLREDSVAAHNTTTYSSLIGATVNAVKAEIEQAFHWNALRDTFTVNTVAGTTSYALTDAGDAIILSAWDTTSGQPMCKGTNREFDAYFFGAPGGVLAPGAPQKYISAGLDVNYDRKIDVMPSPNGVYAMKFNVFKPQADLAADGDIPLVPQSLLIEETVARMRKERGDEMSEIAQMAPGQTFILSDLLATEVSREAGHDSSEMDWEVE